jgi:hypothetical protein
MASGRYPGAPAVVWAIEPGEKLFPDSYRTAPAIDVLVEEPAEPGGAEWQQGRYQKAGAQLPFQGVPEKSAGRRKASVPDRSVEIGGEMTGELLHLLAEQLAHFMYRHVQGAMSKPFSG